MAEFVFISSVVLIAYAYFGYPAVLTTMSRFLGRSIKKADITPKVSLIIAAYNEERDIGRKIQNALALDYPAERLEIIVTSDCSTDRTDEIAREFQGRVTVLRMPHRLGKTAAQNRAVSNATGEILVFSDATTDYDASAVRKLVRSLADPTVGCVAGRLIYRNSASAGVGEGCISYWSYERFLKTQESRLSSLIGVSGCMYAVRRSSYVMLDHDLSSDFVITAEIRLLSLRTVYEPDAICYEDTNRRGADEMRMRVRIIEQTITALSRYRELMNPFRHGLFAFQLISHKIARYLVPWLLIIALVSNLDGAGSTPALNGTLIIQAAFYSMAICGAMMERLRIGWKILAIPSYFVLANVAAAIGLIKFVLGHSHIVWEPVREARQAQ